MSLHERNKPPVCFESAIVVFDIIAASPLFSGSVALTDSALKKLFMHM